MDRVCRSVRLCYRKGRPRPFPNLPPHSRQVGEDAGEPRNLAPIARQPSAINPLSSCSPFPLFKTMQPTLALAVDPWILAFSAITVVVTIWMGFRSAKTSKTASDFFVAGRSVSVGWNASAISGEYLSAASFMGVAGMVMSSGYDALWYPVCYACGYLFLLLFIPGPLPRFGA